MNRWSCPWAGSGYSLQLHRENRESHPTCALWQALLHQKVLLPDRLESRHLVFLDSEQWGLTILYPHSVEAFIFSFYKWFWLTDLHHYYSLKTTFILPVTQFKFVIIKKPDPTRLLHNVSMQYQNAHHYNGKSCILTGFLKEGRLHLCTFPCSIHTELPSIPHHLCKPSQAGKRHPLSAVEGRECCYSDKTRRPCLAFLKRTEWPPFTS